VVEPIAGRRGEVMRLDPHALPRITARRVADILKFIESRAT
jgi:hypothetical protein